MATPASLAPPPGLRAGAGASAAPPPGLASARNGPRSGGRVRVGAGAGTGGRREGSAVDSPSSGSSQQPRESSHYSNEQSSESQSQSQTNRRFPHPSSGRHSHNSSTSASATPSASTSTFMTMFPSASTPATTTPGSTHPVTSPNVNKNKSPPAIPLVEEEKTYVPREKGDRITYVRTELLKLARSPNVKVPEGMLPLAMWFGEVHAKTPSLNHTSSFHHASAAPLTSDRDRGINVGDSGRPRRLPRGASSGPFGSDVTMGNGGAVGTPGAGTSLDERGYGSGRGGRAALGARGLGGGRSPTKTFSNLDDGLNASSPGYRGDRPRKGDRGLERWDGGRGVAGGGPPGLAIEEDSALGPGGRYGDRGERVGGGGVGAVGGMRNGETRSGNGLAGFASPVRDGAAIRSARPAGKFGDEEFFRDRPPHSAAREYTTRANEAANWRTKNPRAAEEMDAVQARSGRRWNEPSGSYRDPHTRDGDRRNHYGHGYGNDEDKVPEWMMDADEGNAGGIKDGGGHLGDVEEDDTNDDLTFGDDAALPTKKPTGLEAFGGQNDAIMKYKLAMKERDRRLRGEPNPPHVVPQLDDPAIAMQSSATGMRSSEHLQNLLPAGISSATGSLSFLLPNAKAKQPTIAPETPANKAGNHKSRFAKFFDPEAEAKNQQAAPSPSIVAAAVIATTTVQTEQLDQKTQGLAALLGIQSTASPLLAHQAHNPTPGLMQHLMASPSPQPGVAHSPLTEQKSVAGSGPAPQVDEHMNRLLGMLKVGGPTPSSHSASQSPVISRAPSRQHIAPQPSQQPIASSTFSPQVSRPELSASASPVNSVHRQPSGSQEIYRQDKPEQVLPPSFSMNHHLTPEMPRQQPNHVLDQYPSSSEGGSHQEQQNDQQPMSPQNHSPVNRQLNESRGLPDMQQQPPQHQQHQQHFHPNSKSPPHGGPLPAFFQGPHGMLSPGLPGQQQQQRLPIELMSHGPAELAARMQADAHMNNPQFGGGLALPQQHRPPPPGMMGPGGFAQPPPSGQPLPYWMMNGAPPPPGQQGPPIPGRPNDPRLPPPGYLNGPPMMGLQQIPPHILQQLPPGMRPPPTGLLPPLGMNGGLGHQGPQSPQGIPNTQGLQSPPPFGQQMPPNMIPGGMGQGPMPPPPFGLNGGPIPPQMMRLTPQQQQMGQDLMAMLGGGPPVQRQ